MKIIKIKQNEKEIIEWEKLFLGQKRRGYIGRVANAFDNAMFISTNLESRKNILLHTASKTHRVLYRHMK